MKKKYVFVTYGSKRIKGVQTKVINIAKTLPKDEVIIINHGDNSWIKLSGFEVYNINFNTFDLANKLIDKKLLDYIKEAKMVIFGDFPTNMLLELMIFWHTYKNTNIPICICDNIYNSSQFKNKIYSLFYSLSDLMLLSGLNMFQPYLKNFPKAKLIPPFFSAPNNNQKFYRKMLLQEANVPDRGQKIIFHIAYNEKVFNLVKKIITNLKYTNIIHIVIAPTSMAIDQNKFKNTYLLTKKIDEEIIGHYIFASDIIICKFGYQQLIESLSLFKPTIAVGDSGLKKFWLDKNLSKAFLYFPTYSKKLVQHLEKLIIDENYYLKTINLIKNLHNGTYDGAKRAANIIKSFKKPNKRRVLPAKKLLLSFNTKSNLIKIKKIIKNELFIFPVIISNKFAERDFEYTKTSNPQVDNLSKFSYIDNQDYLDSSFSMIFSFSPIAYHSLGPVLPYVNLIIKTIEKLIQESQKIYLVGPEAQIFFKNIILRLKAQFKVIKI